MWAKKISAYLLAGVIWLVGGTTKALLRIAVYPALAASIVQPILVVGAVVVAMVVVAMSSTPPQIYD